MKYQFKHFILLFLGLLVVCHSTRAQQTPEDRLRVGKSLAAKGDWRGAEENLRLYLRAHPDAAEVTVMHAVSLVRLEQPFDAVIEIESYLAKNPDSVPVLKLYAELLRTIVRDRPAAEDALNKAAHLAPDDVQIWSELGHSYLARVNNQDAVRCYEQATRLAPRDPVLMASLAYAYGQTNQTAKAEPLFARALKTAASVGGQPDLLVRLLYARHLLDNGKAAESIPYFTKVLLGDPHLSDAYYWRATAHEKLKDYKSAELDALAAIRENEKRRDAYNLLLRLARTGGDGAKAEKYATLIEQITTDEEQARSRDRKLRMALRDAERFLQKGRFADAIPHYETIVATLPSFYEAHFALGMCYFQTGKLAEAEASLKKYLALQPLSPDGNAALGVVLIQRGRLTEAKPFLQQALELDPTLGEARKALAQIYLSNAEATAAERELSTLAAVEGGCDAECYLLLAKAKFKLGKKDEVAEICNRGLKTFGTSPDYLKGLAAFLLETSARQPQTREIVERVAAMLPNDAEAHYLAAKLAYLNGESEPCLANLTTALQSNPDTRTRMLIGALLGETEERLGHYERAEQAYRISWETNRQLSAPEGNVALSYAIFLARRSRDEEALRLLEQLLQWSPAFGAAHFERAKLLARRNEPEKAAAAAEQALRYSLSDAESTTAAHFFLIRTYWALGRPKDAQEHQRWIEAHRQ